MTLVAVQCRLSSVRLPGKALLELGGKTVLDWTLAAMKKVNADEYYVACDRDSTEKLAPIAARNGYKLFEGPLEDVLERFCLLIKKTGADIVIRATADNPFLFYEAASSLLEVYKRRSETGKCDYITYGNLPHGSGIEIFNARSLLAAQTQTNDPYDREHVGPSLYRHQDKFTCFTVQSPPEWNHPEIRTTIDTPADYRRALSVVKKISGSSPSLKSKDICPCTSEQIITAFKDPAVIHPVLCVPCVKKGRGTGHLRRCLSLAVSLGCDVFIPDNADLEEKGELLEEAKQNGLEPWMIVNSLNPLSSPSFSAECFSSQPAFSSLESGYYSLIVTDAFLLEREFAQMLCKAAPILAIDEGSLNTDLCDCLLDIIPSYGIARPANISDPSYVTLPKNKRTLPQIKSRGEIKHILVTAGGEDPADLAVPAALAFSNFCEDITATAQNPAAAEERVKSSPHCRNIKFVPPIHNLREQLYKYDLVVTHYGFTAFEALAAGCAVILLGTTPLHVQLAEKYGFVCIPSSEIDKESADSALSDVNLLYPSSPLTNEGKANSSKSSPDAPKKSLTSLVKNLAKGRRFVCPVCLGEPPASGSSNQQPSSSQASKPSSASQGASPKTKIAWKGYEDLIVARTPSRTFRRCKNCGIIYISWTADEQNVAYDEKYFFESYKKQYGKTYLEDFASIKAQCIRRISIIDFIYRGSGKTFRKAVTPSVLDVGCAFGPYMDAANDSGWQVYGTDISKEAVSYIQETLHYPAVCASFPAFDSSAEFGIAKFDAVTMWYVIEHFQNVDEVLRSVAKLLKKGGVFAFSTPSAAGVSAKFNTRAFYKASPSDHFTIWEPSKTASILKRYGFKVVKIVSTGHHPERFPLIAKQIKKSGKIKSTDLRYALYAFASRFFELGDTFEVYCKKEKDLYK